jgi:hypothetical protein
MMRTKRLSQEMDMLQMETLIGGCWFFAHVSMLR